MDENLVLILFVLLPAVFGALFVAFMRKRDWTMALPGWARLCLGNLLVLGFLFALVLLGGEIYFRFFYDSTDALGYTKVSKRWYQRHWHPNGSDCRDDVDYALKVKPGLRRVTFLGDSFTAGHGIANVEDRFANQIRKLHPEWEIQVLAQPGFDTGNELDYLQGCLAKGYAVDQVVLVYCLNDVADMFPEWTETVGKIRASEESKNWLIQSSYFLNTLYYRVAVQRGAEARSYFDYIKKGYHGAPWEQQKQRLKSLRDLVESHGGHLAVITFPFMHALGRDYEYQYAHDELDQLWKELHVPHLDLLPLYREFPSQKVTVSRFDGHPNEYANRLATPLIDGFLKEQMDRAGERRNPGAAK